MCVSYLKDVGIIMSYACPSACRHCVYNCGPHRKAKITPELLYEALRVLSLHSYPPQVHLTGGEPFLDFDLLCTGVRMASELGLNVYLETSAVWCVDEDVALDYFIALRQAGLKALLISCSPFHAEHIPPARTVRALRAARCVFPFDRVWGYRTEFLDMMRSFSLRTPTPLSRYVEHFGLQAARRILWQGYGIIAGGRAGDALDFLAPHDPASHFAAQNCSAELLYAPHSHMDLHANFIPAFCGGISLGNWHTSPNLLADFQAGLYPPLVKILLEHGPYGLMLWAQEQYAYRPRANGYAGKCHLCVDVRRHLVQAGSFAELQPLDFYESFG